MNPHMNRPFPRHSICLRRRASARAHWRTQLLNYVFAAIIRMDHGLGGKILLVVLVHNQGGRVQDAPES